MSEEALDELAEVGAEHLNAMTMIKEAFNTNSRKAKHLKITELL